MTIGDPNNLDTYNRPSFLQNCKKRIMNTAGHLYGYLPKDGIVSAVKDIVVCTVYNIFQDVAQPIYLVFGGTIEKKNIIYDEDSNFFVQGLVLSTVGGIAAAYLFPGPSLKMGATYAAMHHTLLRGGARVTTAMGMQPGKSRNIAGLGITGIASFVSYKFANIVLKATLSGKSVIPLTIVSVIALFVTGRLSNQVEKSLAT